MKVEIFFDYLCPFCDAGHTMWIDLLPKYPDIAPVFVPVEAHPREEEPDGRHSDIAIEAALFVREHGGDEAAFHDNLFEAVYKKRENIEDLEVLARYAEKAGVNKDACKKALKDGVYKAEQLENNRYAYGKRDVYAVPTFIAQGGRRLDAALGVGITKTDLEALFRGN